MTDDTRPRAAAGLERLLGGRPGAVLFKLVLLSLLVGFVMALFNFDAGDLVRGAVNLVRDTIRDGAGMFRQMGAYILAGAAIVVPVWLVMRLVRTR